MATFHADGSRPYTVHTKTWSLYKEDTFITSTKMDIFDRPKKYYYKSNSQRMIKCHNVHTKSTMEMDYDVSAIHCDVTCFCTLNIIGDSCSVNKGRTVNVKSSGSFNFSASLNGFKYKNKKNSGNVRYVTLHIY